MDYPVPVPLEMGPIVFEELRMFSSPGVGASGSVGSKIRSFPAQFSSSERSKSNFQEAGATGVSESESQNSSVRKLPGPLLPKDEVSLGSQMTINPYCRILGLRGKSPLGFTHPSNGCLPFYEIQSLPPSRGLCHIPLAARRPHVSRKRPSPSGLPSHLGDSSETFP